MSFFYNYLGIKIIISLVISLLVGLLDVFGLAMFLPLLQMVTDTTIDAEKMGFLSFIVHFIEGMGMQLSLEVALVFMLFFFTLKGIVKYLSDRFNVELDQFLVRQIRFDLINGLNKVTYNYFVTSDVGRIQNTLTGELDRVAMAYHSYFKTLHNAVFVGVYMFFAFLINWQFAILVAIGGGLTHFIYRVVYKKTALASKDLTQNYHDFEGDLIQHVSNYKYLKATGLIKTYGDRLKNNIIEIDALTKKMRLMGASLNALREPLLMAVVATVLILQSRFFEANLSHLLMSLLFFYRALSSLAALQSSWNNYKGVSGSLENMRAFQAELKSNGDKPTAFNAVTLQKKIELHQVNFNYGKTSILTAINLSIQKNESVAFVGESGAGKTTLVNLISGLLYPDSGTIQIDGVQYENIDLHAFQQRIGYITQEPVIFNDTIYNNVSFWAPKTNENMERFQQAITKAALHQFIIGLPEQENTQLGNNGINLSGGQKQRISIARELFKDIDILIMDEATSSLDSETEQLIQDQIEALQGQYTILIIAHRLSTIKHADRVVLMENGGIRNVGSFEELLLHDESFKKMVTSQVI